MQTEKLAFGNVTKKIRYQFPYKAIIHDLDGTLTEKGADSWATPYWKHNAKQAECTTTEDEKSTYNGLLCDNTVQVRRIVMHSY